MMFCSQFEQFDPKEGRVPALPFSVLTDIARRARLILNRRSRDEIAAAAEMISDVLRSYFDAAEQRFIDDQLQGNGWACKYLDNGNYSAKGLRDLIFRGLPDTASEDEYFDFPTEDNTTELQALKDCVDLYDFGHEGFKNPKHPELFAVLALWYVGDYLRWVVRGHAKPAGQDQVTNSDKGILGLFQYAPVNLVLAARDSLMAMDSVCYAEHLGAIASAREQLDGLAERKAAKRRSEDARQAAFKRHRETAGFREDVIRFYEKNESSFKSVEAAARNIIERKLVIATHRTIVDWLHAYRKQRSAGRP